MHWIIQKREQKIKIKSKTTISEKQKINIENGKPKNAGLPWTENLKLELYSLFNKNKSINDLANHFGRTRGAILAELTHQGIIKKEDYSKYKD